MKKSQFVFSLIVVVILLLVVVSGVHYYDKSKGVAYSVAQIDSKAGQSYITNIIQETQSNVNFRKVLFTGTRSQLVIMNIPPGGEVGVETHIYTEQTLFFLSGTGEAVLDGKISPIGGGDVVVVVPGTEHNFINTGTVPLKIYTVYAPPNHIDGTTEATKAEADANVQDEAYGNQPK
jgi:mannose-6-phosphate isomerase-like protein (cupin superfamily)